MKKTIFLLLFLLCSVVYGQTDCNDQSACNYDPQASGTSECFYINDPCDDNNGATINDAYDDKCECAGIADLPFSYSIQNSCNCMLPENIDLDGNGSIDLLFETVVFMGVVGQDWNLISGNGLLDMNGNALTMLSATETQNGIYEVSFYHEPGVGYFSNWNNGSNTQVIFNSCAPCDGDLATIPTMSQWGLIILALLMLNMLTLFVYSSKYQSQQTTIALTNI